MRGRWGLFRHYWLRYVIPAALVAILLAGGGFAALESKSVDSYWEGVWWALSLMTTVGFAEHAPETTAGQVLSAILMVTGFALLATATAVIASLFVEQVELPEEERERAFEHEAL